MAMSERTYRERERVLREHRNAIDALAKKASAEVEERYTKMYGENWRQDLSIEKTSVLEEALRMEKVQAQARIEEVIFGLRSTQSSSSMSLIRK